MNPMTTIVAGRIMNLDSLDNKVVTVNYTDPINNNKVVQRVVNNVPFRTESEMCFTQNITMQVNDKFINLMVEPGDSLFVEIDMNQFRKGKFEGITLSGNSKYHEFNQQLPAFYDALVPMMYTDFDFNQSSKDFMAQFKQKLNDSYALIDKYALQYNISKDLIAWTKRDLKYVYVNFVQDYRGLDEDDRINVLTDSLFDVANEDNFKSMMFAYHLQVTTYAILGSDGVHRKMLSVGSDVDKLFKRGLDVLKKQPATICRDYMIYSITRNVLEDVPSCYELLDEDDFVDPWFYEKLNPELEEEHTVYDSFESDGISYKEKNGTITKIETDDFIKYLARKSPNKVLYIDVWATWCGPCLAEMKYSKDLKKLYKDDQVSFIYLCLGSNENKWLPAIKTHKIGGSNYFFDADATQLFLSQYGLTGYPSYLLVDKEGNISTTNAPRPSATALVTTAIDELLKN